MHERVQIVTSFIENANQQVRNAQESERRRARGERLRAALYLVSWPPGYDYQRPETNPSGYWTAAAWTDRFLNTANVLRAEGITTIPPEFRTAGFPAHQCVFELWQLALDNNRLELESRFGEMIALPNAYHDLTLAILDTSSWLAGSTEPGDCFCHSPEPEMRTPDELLQVVRRLRADIQRTILPDRVRRMGKGGRRRGVHLE